MNPIPPRSPGDNDGESEGRAADAAFLFRDEAAPRPAPTPEAPAPAASDSGAGYDLGGVEEAEGSDARPVPPVPPVLPRARLKKSAESGTREPDATVDEVWTRGGEWGPDLVRLGLVAFGAGMLMFLAVEASLYSLAFLIFVAAGVALAILSYPIMITLERPVRVTPEQAARDYFAALSHLRPHYRRMWLLLSTRGREAPAFGSFESFRAYWEGQIDRLRGPGPGRFNPFDFEVEGFKSEKSAGLTALVAEFTIRVVRRGAQGEAPIESHPKSIGLVRGPDKMWYLNRGDLASERS